MLIRQKKQRASRKLSSVSNLTKRIYITKSSRHIYLSLFCRVENRELFTISTLTSKSSNVNCNNSKSARLVAEKFVSDYNLQEYGKAFFDRRTHRFHGNVKVVADILKKNNII